MRFNYSLIRRKNSKRCIGRNICSKYGLELPGLKWTTPPKLIENDKAKIGRDFQIQTDRIVVANQLDIMVVDTQEKKAAGVDVPIPSDSNVRKKEQERAKQGARKDVVIRALWPVTPKMGELLQQIQGQISEIFVQNDAILGTPKMLRRTLSITGH